MITLFMLFLALFIASFFYWKKFGYVVLSLMLIYIWAPFFLIETSGKRAPYPRYVAWGLVALGGGIAWSTRNVRLFVAFVVWGLAVFALLTIFKSELFDRTRINIWRLYSMGIVSFAFFVSWLLGIFWIVKYPQFNLSCDDIYDRFLPQTQTINFEKFSSGFKHLIGADSLLSTQQFTGEFLTGVQVVDSTGFSIDELKFKLKNIFSNTRLQLKEGFFDREQKPLYGMCEYLTKEIQKKYTNPIFKVSVILLLGILFSPFVKMLLSVVRIVGVLLLWLLLKLKIYRIKQLVRPKEEIE